MDKSKRYLTVRVLYPKPDNLDDTLVAVRQVADAASKFGGLVEIGAWMDSANNRIVNISLWESEADAIAATQKMHRSFSAVPWSDWERQPSDNFLGLTRVV
jgi:hypothetical protein